MRCWAPGRVACYKVRKTVGRDSADIETVAGEGLGPGGPWEVLQQSC